MSDDLDKFFAKKAAKKNKKIVAQDMGTLAKRLEKAVRQQEQIDRDREEEERARERAMFEAHRTEEDDEWINVQETVVAEVDLKGLRDLNIDEISDDDKLLDDEPLEKPKTWNTVGPTVTAEVTSEETQAEEKATPTEEEKAPQVSAAPAAPEMKKYVPPSMRGGSRASATMTGQQNQPNLQDAEEFPSLAAAVDMSAKELEKKKLKALQAKEFEEREKARREREQEMDRQRLADRRTTPTPEHFRTEISESAPVSAVVPTEDSSTPKTYVVPQRRRQ